MHLLVTGRSGSGKTTICGALQEMNIPAFDADHIDDLADWVDLKTKLPAEVDYGLPIDKRRVGWLWAKPVLEEFLSAHRTAVICGSSDNQLDFYRSFDKVVFLSLPPDEQIRRIQSRGEHDYGKAPGMAEQIVREQDVLLRKSRDLGAIIINANRSPRLVALDISKHLR